MEVYQYNGIAFTPLQIMANTWLYRYWRYYFLILDAKSSTIIKSTLYRQGGALDRICFFNGMV